ncbi:YeeE/YedE family protein [Candidatus Woesearchaeota archaeon]|nr:YeeE/YedE family protein [Candidatus Woesearchaeota archaeon]
MKALAALIGGLLFGIGLALSGMIVPEVILSFLYLEDLGLLFVLGGAVVVTLLFYQLVPRLRKKSLDGHEFGTKRVSIDKRLVFGSALFGVGWALSGVCPGPALAGLGAGNFAMGFVLVGMLAGAYVEKFFR